jgi:RNA polymerase sigma-70 factor (ECF subfamily)
VPASKNLKDDPQALSGDPARFVSPADWALLEAVRRGDGSAAQSLYERLYPVVDYTLHRVLRSREPDFDDLVQSAFERIVRAIAEERFLGRSALTTWAAAIAGHVAIDHLRRTVREQSALRDLPPAATLTAPELRMEAREEIRRLQGVLARMPRRLVEPVLLFDVLGHSLEDAAEIMSISKSAAQSRLHRGRQELVRRAGAATKK